MASPVERAREMRKALTPPEARLWVALKALKAEGFHFRKQAPVAGYVLDFACLSRRLCVEVDGQHHDFPDQIRHDARRDAVLSRLGFRTLRFRAVDVRDGLERVMDGIRQAAAERRRLWDG